NAGAEAMSRRSMGFTERLHDTDSTRELERVFPPEFRNRLDSIVQFQSLPLDIVYQVIDKFLVELQVLLDDKGVTLEVDDSARKYLVDQGYDPKMGARPMARLIQTQLKMPLAEEVLFGKLHQGGHVKIGYENGKLAFTYVQAQVLAETNS
ncbi:MAG TPA: ATP-dependent Clp protease ATP-binding subunit ClpA, partial [Gammaproteobacteria bacterium]|nr:ATP-dependent Clp protease ATP-binding subunit ClpA [Gammaproteobacteria bacterium]